MASALGSLPTLLNYMQNRSYQRDRLAQYDEQLQLQRDRMQADADYRAADLAARERRDNISARQAAVGEGNLIINQAVEADRATQFGQEQTTLANTRVMDQVVPGLGDSITPNRYGGWDISEEGMNTLLSQYPEQAKYIATQAAGFRALNDGVDNYDGFTGFTPITQPDGSIAYAVGVANANTSGPLAAGGSTADDAEVTLIPAAEMRKIFSQGLSAVHNNGGRDSKAFQTRALGDVFLDQAPFRDPMEQAAGAALGGTASQLSQAGMPDGVDAIRGTALNLGEASYDDLATILRDNGMTDEEIEATFPRAQTEPQQVTTNESEDRTGLSRDLTKLLKSRDQFREVAGSEPDPNLPEEVRLSYSGRAERGAQLAQSKEEEIREYAAGLEAEIADLERRQKGNPRARAIFDQRIAEKQRDFEFLNPTAVTPQSDLDGIDPPDQTITLGNMRELIVEKGWKPTEDQVNQTADLLKRSGVQSVMDIPAKLRPREVTLAMTVLASSQELDPAQQVDLINKMVNFASSGDTTYGIPQVADDVNSAQNTVIRGLEYDLGVQKFNQATAEAFDDAVMESNAELANLAQRINDPEVDDPVNDAQVITGLAQFRANFEDLRGPRKLIAGQGYKEGIGVLLKKFAADNAPNSILERIENIFRRDPRTDMYVNDPITMLRRNEDGDYAFVDPYSGDAIVEGVIPRGMMVDLFGPQYEDFISELANLQAPVEF